MDLNYLVLGPASEHGPYLKSYGIEDLQEEVRRTQAWNLKSRIEFTMNSRNPRLFQNLYGAI